MSEYHTVVMGPNRKSTKKNLAKNSTNNNKETLAPLRKVVKCQKTKIQIRLNIRRRRRFITLEQSNPL